MSRKKPKVKNQPNPDKIPRTKIDIEEYKNHKPSWQFQKFDFVGEWNWDTFIQHEDVKNLTLKLKDFESMFWKDIFNRFHHEVKVERLCSKAQRRLRDLGHDDIENLVSLRFGSKKRIWGIKKGSTLKILWWDPNHQVCPSLP